MPREITGKYFRKVLKRLDVEFRRPEEWMQPRAQISGLHVSASFALFHTGSGLDKSSRLMDVEPIEFWYVTCAVFEILLKGPSELSSWEKNIYIRHQFEIDGTTSIDLVDIDRGSHKLVTYMRQQLSGDKKRDVELLNGVMQRIVGLATEFEVLEGEIRAKR